MTKESSAMTNNSITSREPKISPEALALLGGGKIAYVKMVRSEDVRKQFPQAPQLAPGTLLYALHAADGTPILLTDSREAAIANAKKRKRFGGDLGFSGGDTVVGHG